MEILEPELLVGMFDSLKVVYYIKAYEKTIKKDD